MSTILSETSLLDGLIEPLVDVMTVEQARRIADLRADEPTQLRADDLAERANRGTLTKAEEAEYASFLAGYQFLSVLQLRARRLLKASS
jgi:hypothetical protein